MTIPANVGIKKRRYFRRSRQRNKNNRTPNIKQKLRKPPWTNNLFRPIFHKFYSLPRRAISYSAVTFQPRARQLLIFPIPGNKTTINRNLPLRLPRFSFHRRGKIPPRRVNADRKVSRSTIFHCRCSSALIIHANC